MEVIKRKILLEDSIDRTYNSPNWGVITATTFYINVFINQNMDDMGLFTDMSFINSGNEPPTPPDYTILNDKLNASGLTFPFMVGITPAIMTGITGTTALVLRLPGTSDVSHYNYGNLIITGFTESKIEDLRSYKTGVPYQVGFDIDKNNYFDYTGYGVSGHSRVVGMSEPRIYVFDTLIDGNMGTTSQVYGLLYNDYTGKSRTVIADNVKVKIPQTTFQYVGEGWNQTNVSLSALTKEEYLFGIISPPEVQSDVFIDRGETTVMDKHLRFSEIKNLGQLARYGNGFYNLTKV